MDTINSLNGKTPQTTELQTAVGRSVNSVFQALQDKKVSINDISFFFDDIGAWKTAVEDLDITNELKQADNSAMSNMKDTLDRELSSVPAEDAMDISAAIMGFTHLYRLIARKAYQKGLEDGKAVID